VIGSFLFDSALSSKSERFLPARKDANPELEIIQHNNERQDGTFQDWKLLEKIS
jgi:hypothetical protein